MNLKQEPKVHNITVNPRDTTAYKCSCGCQLFSQGVLLRTLSTLIGGGEEPAPYPVLYCIKCQKIAPCRVPKEFLSDSEQV